MHGEANNHGKADNKNEEYKLDKSKYSSFFSRTHMTADFCR